MSALVDFGLARSVAARVSPGPAVSPVEARAVAAELKRAAVRAEEHVASVTGLSAPGTPPPALVFDRPTWSASNLEGFRVIVGPLAHRLEARALERGRPISPAARAATSKVAGLELGSVLGWVSTKVLGQYEVLRPPGDPGRLVFVAPNVVDVEQRLGVDPSDFRLWVALHEVTHRTQFTAVPWLREHVVSELNALLEASKLDDPAEFADRLRRGLSELPRGGSLVEAFASPEQRVILSRVSGFMSLLEGHADHVMDAVGPDVVPSVEEIRRRFDERRHQSHGLLEGVLRRLLGFDMKALQYQEGKRFTDAVVSRIGMSGFNTVWESPQTLPSLEEIKAPEQWMRRVLST